jgi:preprotein translocase subunit SecE
VGFSYLIIAILLAIIIAFLWFLLKNIFHAFHRELEVKKILWASYHQIINGFVSLTVNVLWFSFLICLALLLVSWISINYYIYTLFDITLWSIFSNIILVVGMFLAEIIIISWVGFWFSYFFARSLNKKL